MNKATEMKTAEEPFDSWDYCINFWAGAIDNEEDTALAVRELNANRHGQRGGHE
jgi:hypothetical protein